MKPEKAVTFLNPWGYLIARGIKPVENRTWKTHFRGRIYIHSSGKWDYRSRSMSKLFSLDQWIELSKNGQDQKMIIKKLPIYAIIGEVDIVDCVEYHSSIWAEKEPGIWKWVLKNPVLYDKPILNVKGALSFWRYPNLKKSLEKN